MLNLLKSEVYLLVATMSGWLIFYCCVRRSEISGLGLRLVSLMIYCITIAFLSPSVLFYNIACFFIVPMFASTKQQITPVFLFALLTLPNVSIPFSLGGLYLTTANASICLTIGASLLVLLRCHNYKGHWSIYSLAIFILFVMTMIPSARSGSATNILREAVTSGLLIILPYYIVSRSTRSIDDVKRILLVLVAVGSTLSAFAIFEMRNSWPVYRVIFDHFDVVLGSDLSVKMRGGFIRSAGPFPEPLSFSFWLALLTLCALACSWMFKSRVHQFVFVSFMFVGLFAPQSRGAFLGLACGVVALYCIAGRFSAVMKSLVVIGVAGVMIYSAALSNATVGSIVGVNQDGTRFRDYREQLLDRGLEEARKNIILGVNTQTLERNMADLRQGEGIIDFVNTYLYILLVSGIFGLFAFILALLIPLYDIWTIRTRFIASNLITNAYIGGVMAAISVMLLYNSLGSRSLMSIPIFLALAAVVSNNRSTGDDTTKSSSMANF